MSYHQRRYHNRRQESYGRGVNSKIVTHPRVPAPRVPNHDTGTFSGSWQPLPAWEKRFCIEVGAMSWKRFVKAKRNLHKTDKVYDWNDSAGLRAFNEAKQRFWEKYHGFPCKKSLPSADIYIDKHIDWNQKIDPQISSEIKSVSDEQVVVAEDIDWFSIPLHQIKPTGWDVDF
ncbi:hypothetical protein REPUB_Repub08aG0205600 [Reevesia pubescens]